MEGVEHKAVGVVDYEAEDRGVCNGRKGSKD